MKSIPNWAALMLGFSALTAAPALVGLDETLAAADVAIAEPEEVEYEEPEFGLLKDADGVETTFYTCSACHSEMIISQQGLTRDGWIEMIEWMVEEQGMSEPDEPDLTEILDYLSAHYNIDRPNFPNLQE